MAPIARATINTTHVTVLMEDDAHFLLSGSKTNVDIRLESQLLTLIETSFVFSLFAAIFCSEFLSQTKSIRVSVCALIEWRIQTRLRVDTLVL